MFLSFLTKLVLTKGKPREEEHRSARNIDNKKKILF